MTKKDFELIAEVFAHHRKSYGNRTDSVTLELINDLAEALEQANPRFNRTRFLEACGIEHECHHFNLDNTCQDCGKTKAV